MRTIVHLRTYPLVLPHHLQCFQGKVVPKFLKKLLLKRPSLACDSENSVIMTLLDMYAGCGGMSTGLCMGAANVNLITRWAVDFSPEACQSLRHNHLETEVRHPKAEDFLQLLKAWKNLCETYSLLNTPFSRSSVLPNAEVNVEEAESDTTSCPPDDNGEYEVAKIVGICYGDPKGIKKGSALYYKIHWKGWGSDWDTWEPAAEPKKCDDCIKDFVTDGYNRHILPLPGTVDVICGGPPCQGISGFNRHRNTKEPLEDSKKNIIEFLKP